MRRALTLLAWAALLCACGEKPQTLGATSKDAPPYTGTGSAFVADGWKPGDKTAWESQLKARNQQQNDYGRMN